MLKIELVQVGAVGVVKVLLAVDMAGISAVNQFCKGAGVKAKCNISWVVDFLWQFVILVLVLLVGPSASGFRAPQASSSRGIQCILIQFVSYMPIHSWSTVTTWMRINHYLLYNT